MLTAIGCHGYAGGFAHGVSAEFKVLGQMEPGDFGYSPFKANFPETLWLTPSSWSKAPRADLLFANPPCAPWSGMGKRKKTTDPRVSCWGEVLAAVTIVRPTIFAIESVTGLWRQSPEVVALCRNVGKSLGMSIDVVLHDAKFLGAAQQRRRVFVVGTSVEIDWSIAHHTKTYDEAVAGLASPGIHTLLPDEWKAALALYPDCNSLSDAYHRTFKENSKFLRVPRHTDHVIPPGGIASTYVGNTQVAPSRDRYLGGEEVKRIGCYDDSWTWNTQNVGEMAAYAAKGVTPACGRWLASNASRAIYLHRPVKPGTVRLINRMASSQRRDDMEMRAGEWDITQEFE